MIEGERPIPKEPTPPSEHPKEASSTEGEIFEAKRSPENLPAVEVTFLHVIHAPEYEEQIYERIKSADTILMEYVGKSSQTREAVAKSYNLILASPPGEEKEKAVKLLLGSPHLHDRLIGRLVKEGKGPEIKLIDIGEEHPAFEIYRQESLIASEISTYLFAGKAHEALGKYPSYVEKINEVDRLREEHTLKELEDLIPKYQERRVVVVQGISHTGVHHQFERKFRAAKPKFAITPSFFIYPPTAQLARKKAFFPNQEIPPDDYLRAFVESYIFANGVQAAPLHEKVAFASHLSTRLSPDELRDILKTYSSLFHQNYPEHLPPGSVPIDLLKRAGAATYFETAAELTQKWAEKKGVKLPSKEEPKHLD